MDTDKLLEFFFPPKFHITDTQTTEHTLILNIESESTDAVCPYCSTLSWHIHGKRYRKNISDLPFSDHAVLINIRLNEFTCPNCQKHYVENPFDFFVPRKSITTRCETYLSELKDSFDGNIPLTTDIANHAYIPVAPGVVRHVLANAAITESDRLWLQDFLHRRYPDILEHIPKRIPPSLLKEMTHEIHRHCEKGLHPNLVTLSAYELHCILFQKKED